MDKKNLEEHLKELKKVKLIYFYVENNINLIIHLMFTGQTNLQIKKQASQKKSE